jgi:hypothetical protein
MVHGRLTYMLAYGPRVNGGRPDRPIVMPSGAEFPVDGAAPYSDAVKFFLNAMLSVLNADKADSERVD